MPIKQMDLMAEENMVLNIMEVYKYSKDEYVVTKSKSKRLEVHLCNIALI